MSSVVHWSWNLARFIQRSVASFVFLKPAKYLVCRLVPNSTRPQSQLTSLVQEVVVDPSCRGMLWNVHRLGKPSAKNGWLHNGQSVSRQLRMQRWRTTVTRLSVRLLHLERPTRRPDVERLEPQTCQTHLRDIQMLHLHGEEALLNRRVLPSSLRTRHPS